jgi:hypothetical protein
MIRKTADCEGDPSRVARPSHNERRQNLCTCPNDTAGHLVYAPVTPPQTTLPSVYQAKACGCPADIGSGSFAGARDVRPPLPYAVHGHVPLRGILTYHHDAASAQARADRTSASHARRTFPDELREMPTGG